MGATRHHEERAGVTAVRLAALALTVSVFAITFVSWPAPARASGFTVDTGADGIDAVPGDGVCATAGGECTLRAAVMESNASPGPDAIYVAGGRAYQLSIPGRGEDAAATGDLDITGELTIRGARQQLSIDGGALDRVFDVRSGARVTLREVRIRNGDAGENDGGAIFNGGTLTLDRVLLDENSADDGGGIANHAMLTIVDSIIADNVADDVGGGIESFGTMTIIHSELSTNNGPFGGGGINNFGTMTVQMSAVSHNTSASGRGAGLTNFGPATIDNTTFAANSSHQPGAAIANGSPLVLANVTVARNTSTTGAGGLANSAVGVVELWNVLLAENGENCAFDAPPLLTYHTLDDGTTCGLAGPGDLSSMPGGLDTTAVGGAYPLLPDSPAIDAGGISHCPLTDQRGAPRPVDGDLNGGEECDIGAYEYASIPPPQIAPDLVGDADCNGRTNSIDAALILQVVARLLAKVPCGPLADANADQRLDSVDAALVLQHSAGLL